MYVACIQSLQRLYKGCTDSVQNYAHFAFFPSEKGKSRFRDMHKECTKIAHKRLCASGVCIGKLCTNAKNAPKLLFFYQRLLLSVEYIISQHGVAPSVAGKIYSRQDL